MAFRPDGSHPLSRIRKGVPGYPGQRFEPREMEPCMRRYAPALRIAVVLLGLAALGTVPDRADRQGPSIDPLLRRMMRASEKAMADHGRPDAISDDERRFFKSVASVGVDGAVPTVGVRL